MWTPKSVGDVVATREVTFTDKRSRRRTVVVEIGRPVPAPDDGTWFCPFRIKGLGRTKVHHAGGVDSLQAMLLALRSIEFHLERSARRAGGRLEWLGHEERPIFADRDMLKIYQAAINNLTKGLRWALEVIQDPSAHRKHEKNLDTLLESQGFAKRMDNLR